MNNFYLLIFPVIILLCFITFNLVKKKLNMKRHLNKIEKSNENISFNSYKEKYNGLKRNSLSHQLKNLAIQSGIKICYKKYFYIFIVISILLSLSIILLTSFYLVAFIIFPLMGFILPVMILKFKVRRRKNRFISDFPGAIDAVIRAVQTGLPLFDGFSLLATEFKEPIKGEFQQVVESRKLGSSLQDCVNSLASRIDCAETRFFAAVIHIQSQSGGSIAESLKNLSEVIRSKKRMKDKIKSLAAEAKASAYIIGCLPFFIIAAIYFTSPEYIILLFTTDTGNLTLIASGVWMAVGVAIMYKMVKFEI